GAEHCVRPPRPPALVRAKGSLGVVDPSDARGEHDCILEGLRRSLADVRLHWVRGIAEQRHASPSPAATRRPVIRERRLDRVWFRRLDQRRNWLEPVAVTAKELVARSVGCGCALGYGLEAVPVHATCPGRAEAEAAADTPDLDEAVADALVVEASPRSPGAMSAVT